jgi:hypothetical protein
MWQKLTAINGQFLSDAYDNRTVKQAFCVTTHVFLRGVVHQLLSKSNEKKFPHDKRHSIDRTD